MRFRPSKAVPPRPHRRPRKALSGPNGPALAARPLLYEPLEERALLAWNVAPIVIAPVEGAPVAEQAVADIIVDPGSGLGPADFAATINWGDGATNTADVVSTSQNTTFAVLGTHTYSEEGPESIKITVTHGTDTPKEFTDAVTVGDPAVDVAGGATFTAAEAATPAPQIVATFSDPGSNEDPQTDYSAKIAWGDGSITAGTIAFNSLADDFSVTGGGDHVYAEDGSYTVTVTVSHDSAPAASATSSAIVSDPSVVGAGGYTYTGIENNMNVAFNETVATFTDPAGPEPLSSYSATIIWGTDPITNQPITSAGTIKLGKDNVFTVSGAHAFTEETPTITLGGVITNLAPISVILNHGASLPVTVASSASISDAPLQLTGSASFSAAEGVPLVNVPLATFIDLGGPEGLEDYTAEIAWGDGITTPGSVSVNTVVINGQPQSVFTVTGTHNYHVGGLQTATITVYHDTAPETAVLTAITVSDPPVVPTGNYAFAATEALQSTPQTVATFVDPGGVAPLNEYSATIDWGDGS
ncbi:MAG TPA: hypothetical protein PK867_25385, partial [Pirellulales bacterium]|nr:hypothetical protein [Pirellulales bacterium]